MRHGAFSRRQDIGWTRASGRIAAAARAAPPKPFRSGLPFLCARAIRAPVEAEHKPQGEQGRSQPALFVLQNPTETN